MAEHVEASGDFGIYRVCAGAGFYDFGVLMLMACLWRLG